MSLKRQENLLQITGKDEKRAMLLYGESEISANEVFVDLEDDDLDAKGDVKVIFNRSKGKESFGFFSKKQPVFITAQEMRYEGDSKRFLFKGDIKIWQQKEMLLAGEISFMEETGEIGCSENVRSVFYHELEEEESEEKIEIMAEKMDFNPEDNIISYEENSSLKVKDINLNAQSISVNLKKKDNEMETIAAKGEVRIIQGQTEGNGEEALYIVKKREMMITGSPVVFDEDKGEIRGDKLTFYIGDGKIIVENKRRERSETIIKS